MGWAVVMALLSVMVGVRCDWAPNGAFFSAQLTIATTTDTIQNSPRTSVGTLYYDTAVPATRFEAHTTPDNDGDSAYCLPSSFDEMTMTTDAHHLSPTTTCWPDPNWTHIYNYNLVHHQTFQGMREDDTQASPPLCRAGHDVPLTER